MKSEQLSLFDIPIKPSKTKSQPATQLHQPASLYNLIELAVDLAGERMRNVTNRNTLERWCGKYGADQVRNALVSRHSVVHVHGPGDRRLLSRWEWKLFGPVEEVYASCL